MGILASQWQSDFIEGDIEIGIVGSYAIDNDGAVLDDSVPGFSYDDIEDENMITITGTLIKDNEPPKGFLWGIEDENIGPIDGGWEPTRKRAIKQSLMAAKQFMADAISV